MTIIERIQTLLKEKGLNARDLCRNTGIKDSTFSAWKNRGSNPSAETIAPIADYLDVSIRYLLTGEDVVVERIEPDIDKNAERLLTYWNAFNELGKAQMLASANAFSHVPEYTDKE